MGGTSDRKWWEHLTEKAASMDVDPPSEELCGQDPLRPPCVPVSPRPRDKGFQSVPEGHVVPVSCPVPPSGPPGGVPRLEMLLKRIHSLQSARQTMEKELEEAQSHREGLCQDLEQHSLRAARLHRKEVEAEGQRRRGLCLERQQGLEGAEEQREQLRHLRRECRREFWQQLDAIIDEHKRLRDMHAPAHLEAELVQLESTKEKLLSLERRLMEIEEQVGPEAPVVTRLVEQEQEEARQQLEVQLGLRDQELQRRDRLAEELKQLQLQLPGEAPE
ncbi:synaptonemal complex central element protein 1 isoform X2 [Manacus candei]|uniref:synaptonemal complex central element protein 1 isoform X2 n=1 Tax=Manacus candei TaxID=415023 RepID=UPI002226DD06|nr:synaptonemal complex central element protein 1 isoform X2 [Manacus candei]